MELFPDGLKTLPGLAINLLAVFGQMFYCILIERFSDKNLELIGIITECSKNIDFFLVRLDGRSYGLGRRLQNATDIGGSYSRCYSQPESAYYG